MFLAEQDAGGMGGLGMIIYFVLIFVVIYFMFLRPQKKREQERKDMIGKIKRGDRIVTIGGIHGEIQSVKENHVMLLVDRNTQTTLKVSRSAVNNVINPELVETEDKEA